MSKYLFVLSKGAEDPGRARSCLRLAKLAALKGHEVSLFLMDEAVWLARQARCREIETPEDEIGQLFRFLCDAKAKVLLCRHSAKERLRQEGDLPSGMALCNDMKLMDMAEESKVFSF